MKKSISTSTRFCAVIGNPIGHSLSPAIHNAAFEALDLDYVYLACRVENVKDALSGMRALGNFRGMSVTIPHKTEAVKWVDEVAEADKAIGSINTIINENGRLLGSGTDGPGAVKALTDAGVSLDGKRILMLGSGGAARAISFTLAFSAGVESILLLDVDKTMVRRLADDLQSGTAVTISADLYDGPALSEAMKKTDVIIQCTPVGMHPKIDSSLIPVELFLPHQVVFDVVYTPQETKLLREAASRGLKTVSGAEMFINQAVLQFEKFTGVTAPADVMRKVVMEHLGR